MKQFQDNIVLRETKNNLWDDIHPLIGAGESGGNNKLLWMKGL
jgi:hypothetical protein